jgi:hypothetical protein
VRCCGATIQGNDLILVTVFHDGTSFAIEANASRKIPLKDSADQDTVKAFFTALAGFVRNSNIDKIAIRGRQTSCRTT